jgi:hypothetical protein
MLLLLRTVLWGRWLLVLVLPNLLCQLKKILLVLLPERPFPALEEAFSEALSALKDDCICLLLRAWKASDIGEQNNDYQ